MEYLYSEGPLKYPTALSSVLLSKAFRIGLVLAMGCDLVSAQNSSPGTTDTTLAQSVQELREQVQELRSAVAEMKSEASEYRAQSEELRKELEKLRAPAEPSGSAAAANELASSASSDQRISTVEENAQVLASEVR